MECFSILYFFTKIFLFIIIKYTKKVGVYSVAFIKEYLLIISDIYRAILNNLNFLIFLYELFLLRTIELSYQHGIN